MNNKFIINANLLRKESEFKTQTCVVEKAVAISHSEFDELKSHPLHDNELIAENVDLMYCDKDGNYHCLLVYDSQNGDGLLIESEGASYARYAQYISGAKELVKSYQNPEISLTNGEKKLHELLSETADRIEVFSNLDYSEFSFDDILKDLGCDFDEVKKMLVESAAEMLNRKNNIRSVKINNLDIPFQPEISVEIEKENSEDLSEESTIDMIM